MSKHQTLHIELVTVWNCVKMKYIICGTKLIMKNIESHAVVSTAAQEHYDKCPCIINILVGHFECSVNKFIYIMNNVCTKPLKRCLSDVLMACQLSLVAQVDLSCVKLCTCPPLPCDNKRRVINFKS